MKASHVGLSFCVDEIENIHESFNEERRIQTRFVGNVQINSKDIPNCWQSH